MTCCKLYFLEGVFLKTCRRLFTSSLCSTSRYSTMSNGTPTSPGPSHLERTAESPRQESVSEAEVISISDASETVKLLTLKIAEKTLTFKAGQWVDFIVPGLDRVGGFSMYSSPWQLKESGTMRLAVKRSDDQPAQWVHTKCSIGSKVTVRVGGDHLVYDPVPDSPSWNLLLIAGGIGINPLFSIMNQVCDFHKLRLKVTNGYRPGSVELLYSASSAQELIFRKSISEMIHNHPNISAKYFITRHSINGSEGNLRESVYDQRITDSDLRDALSRLGIDNLLCYVCGPPPMIDSMELTLQREGVPKDSILAEKWW